MTDLWTKLRQRKLVQWAVAYVAFAFALLQGIDIVAQRFDWPAGIERGLIVALVMGFFAALVIAWYHGERGEQRVTGMEILLLAVLLAIGGGFLWQFTRSTRIQTPVMGKPSMASSTTAKAAAHPVAVSAPSSTVIPAKSIAVLPFENLSEDKKNGFFADGMQDLILTKLADIGDLKVISRTSTMQYGSHPQNLTRIGKELGVATLLEGSVQKAGDQVLVNVQLIDARTDAHLWANSYQRKLKNVFGVEGEVAEKIASALNAKLSPDESRRMASGLSEDPEANLLYLRAKHEVDTSFSNDLFVKLRRAIDLYRQAISRAPGFALARADLSFAESRLAFTAAGIQDAGNLRDDARAQAELALKLAPSLPESHLAMGYVAYYGQSDYDAALHAFAAALRLRPNDAAAYAARGYVLHRQDKFGPAIEAVRKAWSLDPNAHDLPWNLGIIYMDQGSYEEAMTTMRNALALQPDNDILRVYYSRCIMLATGNLDRALKEVQGQGTSLAYERSKILAKDRQFEQAITVYKSLPDVLLDLTAGGKDMGLAGLYQSAGEKARARAYAARAMPGLRAQLKAQAGHPAKVWRIRGAMAMAQEILGKHQDALASLKAMLAAGEMSMDRSERSLVVLAAAKGYAGAGRGERAVALLARALTMPAIGSNYSPVMLWIDPVWEPIRKTPAFQALLKKYARYHPPLEHYPAPPTSSTGA